MTTEKNLVTAVGDAVDGTVDQVEMIHHKIANIPIDVLETVVRIEEPLREVRKLQDNIIGGIYDLVRGINKEVTQVANDLLDGGQTMRPRVEEGSSS